MPAVAAAAPAPATSRSRWRGLLLLMLPAAACCCIVLLLLLLSRYRTGEQSPSSAVSPPPPLPPPKGRKGGGAGAGTKRPYTPLDVVMEDSWVAHHHNTSNHDQDEDEADDEWELRYVAVLARHGARYPTKRKLALALDAARWLCSLPTLASPVPLAGLPAWCDATLPALGGAEVAGLAPLGAVEHRRLGKEVAESYLPSSSESMSSVSVSLRAHVTSKARTRDSCRAFRAGAAAVWPPAMAALAACDEPGGESEALLRPYADCARLKAHRAAVVGAEEEEGLDPRLMQEAQAFVARALGLEEAAADAADAAAPVEQAVVLGLFYACQTDLALLAPTPPASAHHDHHHDHDDDSQHARHAAWIAGSPHLGERGGPAPSPSPSSLPLPSPSPSPSPSGNDPPPRSSPPSPSSSSSFSACALLTPALLEAMEAREDRENFHTRGFGLPATREVMAPFLRHVTARMEAAAAAAVTEASSLEVELFFAHDTTLLPTVALLDLIRLDPAEAGGRSGAARAVPYASRLVLEAWGRQGRRRRRRQDEPSGGGDDSSSSTSSSTDTNTGVERVVLAYNGRVLARLDGGLAEWHARYGTALAIRREDVCALDGQDVGPTEL